MTLGRRLLVVVAVELLFVAATRVVLHFLPWDSVGAESIRSLLRVATAALYWYLLKPLILSRTPQLTELRRPLPVAALLLFMAVPVVVGDYRLSTPVAWLFAVTSVPVALKEEFLFRGILQNLLEQRLGAVPAILGTSAVFTVWHLGVWEFTLWTFSQIFFASVLLGLLYVRSGSIAAVIAGHAVYDAIYSFTPLMAPPLPENWGFAPMLAAVGLMGWWALARPRNETVGDPRP